MAVYQIEVDFSCLSLSAGTECLIVFLNVFFFEFRVLISLIHSLYIEKSWTSIAFPYVIRLANENSGLIVEGHFISPQQPI